MQRGIDCITNNNTERNTAMRNIITEIRRAVCSYKFAIAAIGLIITITFAATGDIAKATRTPTAETFDKYLELQSNTEPKPTMTEIIQAALNSEAYKTALPILAALPFTAAFVDDIKSGYIKAYLLRTTRRKYITGKLVAAAVSGGLVTLSFSGMLWALIGLTLASVTTNRYMAYTSPFILYYLLIILHERYFRSIPLISPHEWTLPICLALISVTCAAFALYAERRLKHGNF